MTLFTSCLRNGLLIVAVLATSLVAQAQTADYPDKPIRLVAPYPPGAGTDVIALAAPEPRSTALGASGGYTMAGTTAPPIADFGYSDDNPKVLAAGEQLYVAAGVTGSWAFEAEWGDY